VETFAELQTEFYARGTDYLNQDAAGRTRAKQWLNEAYLEDICSNQPWLFLRQTATTSGEGTGPGEIAVLGLDTFISVVNTTTKMALPVADLGFLEDTYGDLTQTGTASCVYVESTEAGGSFSHIATVKTFPVDSASEIQIRYYLVPAPLVDDTDEPLVPSRWRPLIVDFALVRAEWDRDNPDAADRLEARAQRRLGRMMESELAVSTDPEYVRSTVWEV
jgi:hypothetical protein